VIAAFLWVALGFELLLYVLVTRVLHAAGWYGATAVWLCLAMAFSWRAGLVLTTFRLARVAPLVSWILRETCAFAGMCTLMMCAPLMRRTNDGDSSRCPVLLIHGWSCNSGVWWPLRGVLRRSRAGPVQTIDLDPRRAIEAHAVDVANAVQSLLARTGADQVALVGHSMGGIVARAYAASAAGKGRVARIICIGSPHHGTAVARIARDPAGRDLRPDSAVITGLTEVDPTVPVTSFYSEIDNFVAPQSSAMLDGAENLPCGAIGHFELIVARPVLQAIAIRLEHTR
jgi:pimeloyl-ACP methyl ester carboxylesterase